MCMYVHSTSRVCIADLCVVPLDVVKTRLQTRPGVYGGFADALKTIASEEGPGMLFRGAQATGAGYFAYGGELREPPLNQHIRLPTPPSTNASAPPPSLVTPPLVVVAPQ